MEKVNSIIEGRKDEIISKINSILEEVDPDLHIDQIRFTSNSSKNCEWKKVKYTYKGVTYTKLVYVCP